MPGIALDIGAMVIECADIAAGRERAAVRLQHDRAHLAVCPQAFYRAQQVLQDFRDEAVVPLGTIQRQNANVTRHVEQDEIAHASLPQGGQATSVSPWQPISPAGRVTTVSKRTRPSSVSSTLSATVISSPTKL